MIFLALLVTASLFDDTPRGEVRYVLALDPRFQMEGGVRTASSVQAAAMLSDELLAERLVFDESKPWNKALAVSARLLKLFAVDFTLAAFTATFIHEVFGHGARGRESGLWPTYAFTVPPPWRWFVDPKGPRYAGVTNGAYGDDEELNRAMLVSGIEAEFYTAHWVTADAFKRHGSLRYGDALLYVAAKLSYLPSLLLWARPPQEDTFASNDVEQYAAALAARFNLDAGDDVRQVRRMLAISYIGNALDPMFWISAWHLAVSYAGFGQRAFNLPTFAVGSLRVLPTTRYNLTPFGPEHYLDFFAFSERVAANVYVRAGSSGLAFYGGLGGRLFRYAPLEWLSLGAELDLWLQPQTAFHVRNLYDRPLTFGVNYGASIEISVYGPIGLHGRIAYKTRGHVMGQPLGEGVHGYFGLFVQP